MRSIAIRSAPHIRLQGGAANLSGEITLLGIVVNKLRPIHTELASSDYILALKAYQERLPIYCTGDLIKENGRFILKNPHHFNLDEQAMI